MIRKSVIIALLALAALIPGASQQAQAQKSTGEWTMFPVYSNGVSDIVDTPSKVYYLSAGRLYSYDKENNETYSYSVANKLSDTEISSILYNIEHNYLLIVYASSNMDALYDNGKVVNISDIKDTTLNEQKNITSVVFYNGCIYVSMPTTIVVYDAKTLTVKESARYTAENISKMAVSHGFMYINNNDTYKGKRAPLGTRNLPLSTAFMERNYGTIDYMFALGNSLIMNLSNPLNSFPKGTDIATNWCYTWAPPANLSANAPIQPMKFLADSTAYLVTKSEILFFDKEGNHTSTTTLPAALQGQKIAFTRDLSDCWAGDADGIANYKVDGSTVTVLSDKSKPQGTSSVKEVAFIRGSKDGSRIYFSNLGLTSYKTIGTLKGYSTPQTTNYIENGKIYDATPKDVTMVTVQGINSQNTNQNKLLYCPENFTVDPDNPNIYYICSYHEGLYVFEQKEDGEFVQVGHFDRTNAPVNHNWKYTVGAVGCDVNFDAQGNLWFGVWANDLAYPPYVVLPKSKFKNSDGSLKDLSLITKDDWYESKAKGVDKGERDMGSVFSKDGVMINWDRRFADAVTLFVNDTKGTANTADDTYVERLGILDQDGKTFDPYRWISGIEDGRGRIWLGTANGIVEIAEPKKMTDPTSRITRLKVPRNDGTIYADYLLEGVQVNDIACDASDRKWVATENSGVYLVSQAGDKILEHYTTANSMLPSNAVYSVFCDPRSNIVYFGTVNGLLAYNSTSSPAADDFSEVYAYPNPVRPDYTGWITIKGLMDNSLVKIADSAGNVVAQIKSDGGMAVWDGCNVSGERVRTGVYFVFVSASNGTVDSSSKGAVTKILVVN